jgi:hypothetical protein
MNFEKLEDFMLTGKRLAVTFRKNSLTQNQPSKKFIQKKEIAREIKVDSPKENKFIFPIQKDSLFWCFYIIKNGLESYESLENINIVVEKQMKIECVELLRKNKHLIKASKIAPLTHIENYLANENKIDVKTFIALCIINKINLLYLHKNTYFLLNCNETEDSSVEFESLPVVKRMDEPLKFGVFEDEKGEKIKHYIDTFYKIENMSKPIKALSSYKVSELVDIAKKLGIETTNNTTNKQKTKNEIYELLIQYF